MSLSLSTASVADLLNGPNKPLYDQLTAILANVIKSQPANPLKEFENSLAGANSSASNPSTLSSSSAAVKSRVLENVENQLTLLGLKPKKKLNEDGEEEDDETDPAEIPSFVPSLSSEFRHFRSVGISLPAAEVANLQMNLDDIASRDSTIESIRFWGKVFSLAGDYYVFEAKLSEWPEFEPQVDESGEEIESRVEPWGTGPNEYIYLVNSNLLKPDQWTRLPLLTPEQLVASSGSRRFLTGDLAAPVYGFPRFPGNEASYLRSIIARITHSTTLVPKGKFTADEEEVNIILENDEFKGLSASELRDARNWVHSRMHLLREGRTEHFIESEKDDERLEAERKRNQREREKEIPIKLLRSAAQDKRGLWNIKSSQAIETGIKPVKATEKQIEDGETGPEHVRDSHLTISAHSNLWPGAVSVACGQFTQSIYIGWGLKSLNRPYQPPAPPAFCDEFPDELLESVDPTEKPRGEEEEENEEENDEENEQKDEEEDEDD